MSNTKRRADARKASAMRQNLVFGGVVVLAAAAIIFSATLGGSGNSETANTDLAAAAALEPCPDTVEGAVAVENGLPDHTLDCLGEAKTVNLAGLRGKPLVINVWGSWCPPCVQELPWLAEFHQAAAGQISVLGVNVSDDSDSALQMFIDMGVKFPSLYDPNSETRATLPWNGTPITIFVSAEGEVLYRHEGRLPDENSMYEMAEVIFGIKVTDPTA